MKSNSKIAKFQPSLSFIDALLVAMLLVSYFHQPAYAQITKLYPVDEATQNPSFFVFRARLLEAVQQRDTAFLYSILAPDILNSFGGDGGIAEFREMWNPDLPDTELWKTLMSVLAYGGTFQGSTFAAPYMFSRFPDELDAFEYGVIVGENVNVRERPSAAAPVTATLSYDIVKVVEWDAKQDEKPGSQHTWIKVSLANGSHGYVAERYIRSPIDYRAGFEQRNGRWLLGTLVAGD